MLGPIYIRSFKLVAWVGKVVYNLELPIELSQIQSTFHIFQLLKFLVDDSTVVSFENIQVEERLKYI